MNLDHFDIDKQTAALVATRTAWVAAAADTRRQLMGRWPQLRTVLRLLPASAYAWMYIDDLRITVRLTDMKDAAPIIESLQDAMGAEFDKTEDQPAMGQRIFMSSKFPLQLCIDVADNGDDAACRRVVVGERLEPIYELRCDGEAGPREDLAP